jgi:hypothetical protein
LTSYNNFQTPSVEELRRKEISYCQSKKYSTEQLLKKVEELWRHGEISVEEYFKRIKSIHEELYLIDKKLKDLGVQNETIVKHALE